ncbi:MAG: tetratricopeptide repeat protein, partial [bacterium]
HRKMPEIASELNVDAVVEGTVLRIGDRVRITAQLIKAVPEQHLWAKNYDSNLRDILTLQTEVARSIAKEVRIAVTSEEEKQLSGSYEVDPEMYEAYLKGRFHFFKMTGEGMTKAIEYAQKAIAKDSSYAPAHALLAACYSNLPFYVRAEPKEAFPKAKAAAMKALAIDETLAEAHIRLAWVLAVYDWDWQGAEKAYKRGLELNPGLAVGHRRYGWFLSWIGRFDEAIKEARRAEILDPVSLSVSQNLAAVLIMARRYDEAIAQAKKTIDMDPNFMFAYFRLGWAYEAKGIYEEALESYRKANALAGGRNEMVRLSLGRIYASLGQRTEALKILKEWQDLNTQGYVSPSHTAAIYTCLGQKEKALDLLEKAYDVRDFDMNLLKVWPMWDPLRSEPRFQNLLKRMDFPETKRNSRN